MKKKVNLEKIIKQQRKNLKAGGQTQMESVSTSRPFVTTNAAKVEKLDLTETENLTKPATAPVDNSLAKPATQPQLYKRPSDGYMTQTPIKKRTDYIDIRAFKLERKRKLQEEAEKKQEEEKKAEQEKKYLSVEELLKARGITPGGAKPQPQTIPPRPTTIPPRPVITPSKPIDSASKPKTSNEQKNATPKKKKVDADLLKNRKKSFFDDLN